MDLCDLMEKACLSVWVGRLLLVLYYGVRTLEYFQIFSNHRLIYMLLMSLWGHKELHFRNQDYIFHNFPLF